MRIHTLAAIILSGSLFVGTSGQADASFIYWTDQNTSEISRANLDGSNQQTLVSGQPFGVTGIALDIPASQMYWSRQGSDGNIQRANLDGAGQQTLVDQVSPFGITLDTAAGQMYWTDTGGINDIRRANLDGTGQQVLVTGQNAPAGIALDTNSNKMYWVNQFGGTLWSANLDGTGQKIT